MTIVASPFRRVTYILGQRPAPEADHNRRAGDRTTEDRRRRAIDKGLIQPMAKNQRDELVFVPLGGVGEIGMNMGAYGFGPERSRKWIVVDCGVSFGGPDLPGIELIMANPEFLEERADD